MKMSFLIPLIFLYLLPFKSYSQETSFAENKFAAKEFVRSCTYGVLAGTLVGAATLAFTEQPGENINRVARGASIGLYTGILLGLYVVYIVPGQMKNSLSDDPNLLPSGIDPDDYTFKWGVFPLIGLNGVEGGGLGLSITAF